MGRRPLARPPFRLLLPLKQEPIVSANWTKTWIGKGLSLRARVLPLPHPFGHPRAPCHSKRETGSRGTRGRQHRLGRAAVDDRKGNARHCDAAHSQRSSRAGCARSRRYPQQQLFGGGWSWLPPTVGRYTVGACLGWILPGVPGSFGGCSCRVWQGKHLWRGCPRGWTRVGPTYCGDPIMGSTVPANKSGRHRPALVVRCTYLPNLIPTSFRKDLALSPPQAPSPAGGSCFARGHQGISDAEAAHRPVATAGLVVTTHLAHLNVEGPEEGTASLVAKLVCCMDQEANNKTLDQSTVAGIVCDGVREMLRAPLSGLPLWCST